MKGPNVLRSNDGIIHAPNAANSEYTLCGNAFEGGIDGMTVEGGDDAHREVPNAPVTCEVCARVIRGLKGVRVSRRLEGSDGG